MDPTLLWLNRLSVSIPNSIAIVVAFLRMPFTDSWCWNSLVTHRCQWFGRNGCTETWVIAASLSTLLFSASPRLSGSACTPKRYVNEKSYMWLDDLIRWVDDHFLEPLLDQVWFVRKLHQEQLESFLSCDLKGWRRVNFWFLETMRKLDFLGRADLPCERH